MKKIIYFLITIFVSMSLGSCKTHEQRVLDRITQLSEKVEKNYKKWDKAQWLDALDELEDINHDMEDCEFSTDQRKEIEKAQGRLTVIFMTEGAEILGDDLEPFLEGPGAFMIGYTEYSSEDFEGVIDYSEEELEQSSPQGQE